MLTPEQKNFYHTFGFLVFKQYFSPPETDRIIREFEEVLQEDLPEGQQFTGEKRHTVLGCIERRPALAGLVEDDRVYGVLEDLLGPDFVWITSDGNYYVGDTSWHPDIKRWNPAYALTATYRVIKIAFYLDPVGKDTGCLRVIPGSHRDPLHTALEPMMQHRRVPPVHPFGVTGPEIPSYPLESEPGDMVLMSQGLWHASFGGNRRRRMFTLNFAEKATTDAHVAFHRHLYQSHFQAQQNHPLGPRGVFLPEFLSGGGPRRQAMVKQIVEWGFV
ncbi:MAG: hypothetical protein EXS64_07485 [Candidatus Latescibacteria bacterium]|nr:hypothetical protein [Candidatus Latescibacterota bacterium]